MDCVEANYLKYFCNSEPPDPRAWLTAKHDWRTHTTVNDTVPTGEKHELTGAEINRLENRATKVYCAICLEVRVI